LRIFNPNAKAIKKILKISLICISTIICIPVIVYLISSSPYVQTYVAKVLAENISEITGTPISIKGARLTGLHTLSLKELYIEDYKKDTLIYAKRVNLKLDSFNLDSSRFFINKIELKQMYFNLQEDRNKVLNIEHFIDSLSKGPSDSTSKSLDLHFKNISIVDSKFAYVVENHPKVDYEINWDDILVTDLNLDVENLYFKGDTAFFNARRLSLREKTGFYLKNLSGKTSLCSSNLNIKDVGIITPYSHLNLTELDYKWVPGKNYWLHFVDKMQQLYVLEDSYASFQDIAFFNGKLAGLREVVRGKGTAFNTISKFQVENVELYFGENSKIIGDFSSSGLPYILDANYKVDFDELSIDINDLENIYIPWEDDKKYTFWEKFKNLGNIRYEGLFDGSFENFLCAGTVDTELGKIVTNARLEPTDNANFLDFNGSVQFLDFDLGGLIESTSVGKVKLDAKLNGVFDKTAGFDGVINGNISELSFYDYVYHNLSLDGSINKKKFFGELNLKDKNISVNFMGGIDLNDTFPVANFKSNIKDANLKALNIIDKDLNLSFDVKADFTGNSLESFNGSLNVSNTLFSNASDSVRINSFSLYTGANGGIKQLSLKSDFAAIDIKGEYELSSISNDFLDLIYTYIPNYKPLDYKFNFNIQNRFELDMTVFETRDILKLFYPSLRISDGTTLYWNHHFSNNDIFIDFASPNILYEKSRLKEFTVKLKSDENDIKCTTSVGTMSYDNQYNIHNLKNTIIAKDNRISSDLSWNNWDKATFGGYFSADAEIVRTKNNKTRIDVYFDKGTLLVADSIWTFKPTILSVIGKNIAINDFTISKNDHYINVDGKISTNPNDSLNIIFSKCDLDKFYNLVSKESDDMKGAINGYINISDFYNERKAIADLDISNFVVNNDTIGNIKFKSQWENISERLLINAYNEIANKKQIVIDGWYKPSNDDVDIKVKVDSLNLKSLNNHLDEFARDISGYSNADFSITNKLKDPQFDGYLSLDNSSFILNNTQTKYFCDDTISLHSKKVVLNDFVIKDEANHKATVDGSIQLAAKPLIDISVNLDKFSLLNTREADNENFYGKTILTGRTQISGSSDNLNVEVNVKTEKGTDINIPINNSSSVSSSEFITFIKKDEKINESYTEDDMSQNYVSDYSNINLNCNIELTEDASSQIIFDAKLGDAIKAKGKGNLKLELNSEGEIDLYGTYNITEGSYLFTLRNVINKKFTLGSGGSIKWNGSPYDATIDLNAIYKVRASLYDLMPDNKDPNISASQKIPVNCVMNLTDNLNNPNIKFNIDFPSLNQQNKSYVESLFRGQEDINKQVLFLLIFNRFYTPEYVGIDDTRTNVTNAGVATTVSELLTNQLSNWISQISDDFDFGFKYRPKDEISSDELELALSTQFFSDRVTLNVNGNIDTGNNENAVTKNNTITGDFDLDIKLTQKGNLRFTAFNRTNDQITYKSSKSTQGIGLQYQDEFNSFSELISRYFNAIFRRKEDK